MNSIDFISISLARTGTTWLRENLKHHPDILALGETWGFNLLSIQSRTKFWNECVKAFGDNNSFKIRGDISPSYSLLTSNEIEICKQVNPNLKLIFIVREPVSRGWSHLKHMKSHKEGYFDHGTDFTQALLDPFTITNSNYLLVLQKWQAHFDNIFIYFYEDMVSNPKNFFAKLFSFLGVESVDISSFPAKKVINKSKPIKMPKHIEDYLFSINQLEALQLMSVLQLDKYPAEWEKILTSERFLLNTQKHIISKVKNFEYFTKTVKPYGPILL
jgi:hypothetical protein